MSQAHQAGRRQSMERRRTPAGEGGPHRPVGLPTIAAALADPVVRTMMRADHVDPRELEHALRNMARRLADQVRRGEGSRAG